MAPGAHVPLWDEATMFAIRSDMTRRSENHYHGPRRTYQLSNLVKCGVCEQPMIRSGNRPGDLIEYYFCRQYYKDKSRPHMREHAQPLIQRVALQLVHDLPLADGLHGDNQYGEHDRLEASLAELANRQARIDAAYELGNTTWTSSPNATPS